MNLILKDEYEGADILFHYGINQRDDYSVYHVSVVSGLVDHLSDTSKVSILGAFDYFESSPIMMSARGYSSNLDHTPFGSYYNWESIDSPYGNFIDGQGNTYSVRQGTKGPNITQNNFYPVNSPGSDRKIQAQDVYRMVDNASELASRLAKASPQNLSVTYVIFPDETHASVSLAALGRALYFALKGRCGPVTAGNTIGSH